VSKFMTCSWCKGKFDHKPHETCPLYVRPMTISERELCDALEELCDQIRSGGLPDTLRARSLLAKLRGGK
jgi:hypothetical protein